MALPVNGNIKRKSKNKIEWWLDKNSDQVISPEFVINKNIKAKLLLMRYEGIGNKKDISIDQKQIMVQLLISPEAASTIEKVELTFHASLGRTYVNQRNLSYQPLDSSFPMIVWYCEANLSNNDFPMDPDLVYLTDSYQNDRVDCECFFKTVKPVEPTKPINLNTSIGECYEELFNNSKFSDFTIIVSGTEFKVHKAILSARSKLFADMLEENSKGKKENKIKIDDTDADIMREVLRFIYSGKVNDIEKIACDLVLPADKYELHDLLALCQSIIIHNISPKNIQKILNLINDIELDSVKKSALQFITNNRQLIKTKDFSDFLNKLSPTLLTEIITAF